MTSVVFLIVAAVILIQIHFFVKNIKRMKEYGHVFDGKKTWKLTQAPDTKYVNGISGGGNSVFQSIRISINKYMGNMAGSVIDYQLLRDAVDRHCDALENDINTLTPIPLYCGLAGTMAGVICGLLDILATGSINALLTSGAGDFHAAANGVDGLLTGVAWAMVASICGIVLTTWASLKFKVYKQAGEAGKNSFLAWLQSKVLPELPSDTSQALTKMVIGLNEFNSTFAQNTASLGQALKAVSDTYDKQAKVIETVQKMDVMEMAKANVKVLKQLQNCTDQIAVFNQYLQSINGYTEAIRQFTELFKQEEEKLKLMHSLQDYFTRHKRQLTKQSADVATAPSTRSMCST